MSIQQLRLNLDLVLPELPDEADACVRRLIEELSGRPGIADAHVVRSAASGSAELCIHVDPAVQSVARVVELVRASGATLTKRYGHVLWQVAGLRHQRHSRRVEETLAASVGVIEASVAAGGWVRIEFDRTLATENDLRDVLTGLGLSLPHGPLPGAITLEQPTATVAGEIAAEAQEEKHEHRTGSEAQEHAHGEAIFGANTELYFALLSGALLAIGYVLSIATSTPDWLVRVCYALAYVFGGFYTLREAVESLRNRKFEIDTLMLVAAAGAAVLGEWAEGALLLFLFSLGHSLEHYALGRARRAIEALAKLAPQTADVRREDRIVEVPVEDLVIGNRVIVRPNSRIPADGFVVEGTSSVDQAPVTGESVPVDKKPVDDIGEASAKPDVVAADRRVFAGTINGGGALEIQVTRLSNDTALARVVRMVSEAETQKSPTQRFTERFERAFVPAVLGLATVLMFAWVVVDEPFRDSFYRAMAVLVAASPCALAIAIPSAVLSGVARAARGGVLIKGGAPLENLGTLSAIAFDKTGTLTEGKPRVTDVVPVTGVTESELLAVAVAVESLSDHPLAMAVVRDGRERLGDAAIPRAQNVRSITGRGVSAQVDGQQVLIGKRELFSDGDGAQLSGEINEIVTKLERDGRTIMIVRRADRYLGVLGLMDTPREAAREVVSHLRSLGIEHMIMISGDNPRVAEAVAKQVGIDEARGDLMPEDKVEAIKKLGKERKIAMVGDGVNDAPAMANATVGIAMGAVGSDVALETADVALMGDELRNLPFVVGLSRRTSAVIRQNLWLSLGMVVVLIPATIFGLNIGIAVLFHEGSTLVVVFNALRLLAYRDRARD